MISERLLRKWRKEALSETGIVVVHDQDGSNPHPILVERLDKYSKKVLRLTQELLDQHLINKK